MRLKKISPEVEKATKREVEKREKAKKRKNGSRQREKSGRKEKGGGVLHMYVCVAPQ